MSKATLYLEEPVHKALRLKAAETRQSMSDLVNDALKASLLEDLEDIAAWRERKNDVWQSISVYSGSEPNSSLYKNHLLS